MTGKTIQLDRFNFVKKSISEMAAKLLASQTVQVQLWKADDVDIEKLETLCVSIAYGVWVKTHDKMIEEHLEETKAWEKRDED